MPIRGDALQLSDLLNGDPLAKRGIPLVITSPPYCTAVDYSRRHQLEMYWLGLVKNPGEHIKLRHVYIGRCLVRPRDWDEKVDFRIKRLDDAVARIEEIDRHKARTVCHYFSSMAETLEGLAGVISRTATVVYVVGDSVCRNVPIATADFIAELSAKHFVLKNRFSYAVRNHYMQYGLWNGDGIKEENVLVLKRR